MAHVGQYLDEMAMIIKKIDVPTVEKIIDMLIEIRKNGGRLFFLGVGGSGGNASHAVNDFRKICGIEAYYPLDNVSELTARTNDEGWNTVFRGWLKVSNLKDKDGIFVFSVGGGNKELNISANIVYALEYAKQKGAKVFGIVGRRDGYTAKVADACLVIPTVNNDTITPHTESFQAAIWHLIVSDPRMKVSENKWEGQMRTSLTKAEGRRT